MTGAARETTIVWFREDFRLADNPALLAAAARGVVLPVYLWDPEARGAWAPGGASRVWLHASLTALDKSLRALRSRLIVRTGPVEETLRSLAAESGATGVHWNRRYAPESVEQDKTVKAALSREGLRIESFKGALLFEPWEVHTKGGDPYKVFTPFWKTCRGRLDPGEPLPAPASLLSPETWPESEPINSLELLPTIPWDRGIRDHWMPGEQAARDRLHEFLDQSAIEYAQKRDEPALDGTSLLSPHLHFGEISPRTIWHETQRAHPRGNGAETFLRELGWREFAHHVLFHFPQTASEPLRPEFRQFAWEENAAALRAWQRGGTGYPIVDAGMRQLWRIGWMHNRVRMIVASFLVKDLRVNWIEGARWFWDTLVDADLANNTMGWQWTAGCGADAAPYFRVFNPVLQGEKFDPEGAYVRQWVPELSTLPAKWIHRPWAAPADVLDKADITLGETYPLPMVDHAEARAAALAAFEKVKGK